MHCCREEGEQGWDRLGSRRYWRKQDALGSGDTVDLGPEFSCEHIGAWCMRVRDLRVLPLADPKLNTNCTFANIFSFPDHSFYCK